MISNNITSIDDAIASFGERFDEAIPELKKYIQLKRKEAICPSISIVHAIKEIKLKPKNKNIISILVLGAYSIEGSFNGDFYKFIPELMGNVDLKAKVVLIDPAFYRYTDSSYYVDFENGSSVEFFPGALSEYLLYNSVDNVDLAVMFNPNLCSDPASWFFAGGIDAFRKLIQSGVSIVGSSPCHSLREWDLKNMKMAGFNVSSIFNNPFSFTVDHEDLPPGTKWGRYMWELSSKFDQNIKPNWYKIFEIEDDFFEDEITEEDKVNMMVSELDHTLYLQNRALYATKETNIDRVKDIGEQVYLETIELEKAREAILDGLVLVYPPELREIAKQSENLNTEVDELLADIRSSYIVEYEYEYEDEYEDEDEDENDDELEHSEHGKNGLTELLEFMRDNMDALEEEIDREPNPLGLPLWEAIEVGDAETAVKLAKESPELLREINSDKYHALTLIAPLKGSSDLIRELCNIDKELVNEVDGNSRTALLQASKYNSVENAKALIEFGANLNLITPHVPNPLSIRKMKPFDRSPLLEAVLHENEEMIKLLIENGASPYLETSYGFILDVAMKSKISDGVKKLIMSHK